MFQRQLQRQEDDIRSRMSNTSDAYRKAVTETQAIRQEYFNFQLPRILRVSNPSSPPESRLSLFSQSLKECADEVDLGTQYHLSRYAFLSESVLLNDGSTLSPATPEEGVCGFLHLGDRLARVLDEPFQALASELSSNLLTTAEISKSSCKTMHMRTGVRCAALEERALQTKAL